MGSSMSNRIRVSRLTMFYIVVKNYMQKAVKKSMQKKRQQIYT